METVKCGCGKDVHIYKEKSGLLYEDGMYEYRFACDVCGYWGYFANVESEAIAAFKLATRADVKQGIQWISVKDRLPEQQDNYFVLLDTGCVAIKNYDGKSKFYIYSPVSQITHWAEINLPEKE